MLKSFAANHVLVFAICAVVAWFVCLVLLSGVVSSALQKPFGDALPAAIGRLAITACVLWLIWRMGWLESAGIVSPGRWQAWLVTLAVLVYFSGASLYSFYGVVAFDFSNLLRSPAAQTAALANLGVGLSEEIMFRGLVLCSLARVWGKTKKGLIGSVLLSSLLFSILHIPQVLSSGTAPAAALILAVEAWILSAWWATLVLWSGSVWPAVLLHFAGNALVAVQALTAPLVEPDIIAYSRLLGFSLLPGALGAWLLARPARRA